MICIRTIKQFCKGDITKIENYEKAVADDTQTWECHHRLETHFSDGAERSINAKFTIDELKALDMYFGRPAEELIFMTKHDHTSLHMKGTQNMVGNKNRLGKYHSEETKRKISATRKGKSAWNKGKTGIYSEEIRQKLSEAHKGKHWKLIDGKRVYY